MGNKNPLWQKPEGVLELVAWLEHVTFSLRVRCSTNWATPAFFTILLCFQNFLTHLTSWFRNDQIIQNWQGFCQVCDSTSWLRISCSTDWAIPANSIFDHFFGLFDYLIFGIEEKSSGARTFSHPTCDYLITSELLYLWATLAHNQSRLPVTWYNRRNGLSRRILARSEHAGREVTQNELIWA